VDVLLSNCWDCPWSFDVDSTLDVVEKFSYVGDPPVGHPRERVSVFEDWKSYSQMHLVGFNCNVNGVTKGCPCSQVFQDLKYFLKALFGMKMMKSDSSM